MLRSSDITEFKEAIYKAYDDYRGNVEFEIETLSLSDADKESLRVLMKQPFYLVDTLAEHFEKYLRKSLT